MIASQLGNGWLIMLLICLSTSACALLPSPLREVYMSWKAEQNLKDGIRWEQKRHYDRAEAVFLEALRYRKDFVKAFLHLGDLYFTIEAYDKALNAYNEALSVDQKAYGARVGIWATMLEQSGFSEVTRENVLAQIETYIDQAPTEGDPAEYLYAAYLGLEFLHDDARKAALRGKMVRLEPKKSLVRLLSQDATKDITLSADPNERLELIRSYYALFPPEYWTNQARQIHLKILAEDLGELEQLQIEGEKWIAEEPDNRVAHYTVGNWLSKKDVDLKRSIELLENALELLKNTDSTDKPMNLPEKNWGKDLQMIRGHYLDTLGWTYYKAGKYKEARSILEKAAQILDFDHSLYYHLGMVYEHEGLRQRAIEAYQRSLQADESIKEVRPALQRLVEELDPIQADFNKYFAQQQEVTTFTEVTEKAGLGGISGMRVAWGDYNGDGYEDLLVDGHRLFRNNGNGRFDDVSKATGIITNYGSVGGVWADFNNDSHLDFYMMTQGYGFPGRFLKNNGDGSFTDITLMAIDRINDYHSEGAAWGDYNGDGWVDLYIANYEKPISRAIRYGRGTGDILWRNNGNGTFTDVTQYAGMVTLEKMNGRGVNWGDFNNDGLQDIFVSNYRLDPNFLWKNNGDGTFTNAAEKHGVAGDEKRGNYGHTIGSEWGDYDNDGDLDLFTANLAHPSLLGISDKSMLLENTGPPHYRFKNRTDDAGIRYQETHSDPSFADYDNDGDLDLYITAIYSERPSVLYLNDGQGRFQDITWLAGVRVFNGWGNAFVDFDRDGDLDLAVASRDGIRLFSNDGNQNAWLHVKVLGAQCNQDGIGSRITVKYPGMQQIREVQGGKGTGSQHSLPVEFGFGNYHGTVDLEVRTSCGQVISRPGISLNQMITISE